MCELSKARAGSNDAIKRLARMDPDEHWAEMDPKVERKGDWGEGSSESWGTSQVGSGRASLQYAYYSKPELMIPELHS